MQAHTQALAMFRELGDRTGELYVLNGLEEATDDVTLLTGSREHYERAVELYEQLAMPEAEPRCTSSCISVLVDHLTEEPLANRSTPRAVKIMRRSWALLLRLRDARFADARCDLTSGRWPAVPAEHRARDNREDVLPARSTHRTRQRGGPEPVRGLVTTRTGQLPPKHDVVVLQHNNLRILS
ncbi:hypothetical protein [Lentzea sp. CC55]|uniref:hypothetical protein n=1 Tax=Lentzea sp. CC55 TaxID=2884909 RepID=UPI001F47A199|nr:hypothetical protein [Lentzea sp. CC55]MCG8927590.1 hypothetical protein [Lentzea sp. CC55]